MSGSEIFRLFLKYHDENSSSESYSANSQVTPGSLFRHFISRSLLKSDTSFGPVFINIVTRILWNYALLYEPLSRSNDLNGLFVSLYNIKKNISSYDDTSSLKGSEYAYLLKPWTSKETYLSDMSNQCFLESGELWAVECAAALSLMKQFTPLSWKTDQYLIIDMKCEGVFSMNISCYFEIQFFPPYRSRIWNACLYVYHDASRILDRY